MQKHTFALYTVQVRSTVLYLHQYNTIIWFFIDLTSIWCVVAAAICSMLDDWTGMDKLKAKEYILNCQVDFRKFRMHHILHWNTSICNAYCLILVIICSHMMEALVWFLVLNLMVSNFIWPFDVLLCLLYQLHLENLSFTCHWAMGFRFSLLVFVLASQVEELFVLLRLSI